MKLHTEQNPIGRSGVSEETQFTIKASAKAFSILSSSLYSNKILAIIRELSCNAYDAHVAAGKKEVPFEIKLPTMLDPSFYVKDFGTGLSHDQIMQLYTTYFDSTKTDSDDFVGALGLGSKSPFSYTESFSVESRYNGKKTLYTAFINETGVPSIVRLGEPMDSGEENGLTVRFAVRNGDALKFTQAARTALTYFVPAPTVLGDSYFSINKVEYKVAGEGWGIRNDYDGAQIVQGAVAYPVNADILSDHGVNGSVVSFAQLPIDIIVPIGSVEVAPSREALSYDKRTVQHIAGVLAQIKNEMRASIGKSFVDCDTYWDACLLFNKMKNSGNRTFRSLVMQMHNEQKFKYGDDEIHTVLTIDMNGIDNTTLIAYSRNANSRKKRLEGYSVRDSSNRFNVHINYGTVVIIDDVVKHTITTITDYATKLADQFYAETNGAVSGAYLLVIRPKAKVRDAAEVNRIVASLKGAKTILMSSLPRGTRSTAPSQYKARPKENRLKFTAFNGKSGVFSRLTWKQESVDLNAGGFYIPMERFTPVESRVYVRQLDEILEYSHKLGVFTEAEMNTVYGFSQKEVDAIKGDSKWLNFFDVLLARVAVLIKDKQWMEPYLGSLATETVPYAARSVITDMTTKKTTINKLEDGTFKSFVERFDALNKSSSNVYSSHMSNFLYSIKMVDVWGKKCEAVKAAHEQEWKDVMNMYPLFKLISWKTDFIDDIIEYVNMVDACRPAPVKAAA